MRLLAALVLVATPVWGQAVFEVQTDVVESSMATGDGLESLPLNAYNFYGMQAVPGVIGNGVRGVLGADWLETPATNMFQGDEPYTWAGWVSTRTLTSSGGMTLASRSRFGGNFRWVLQIIYDDLKFFCSGDGTAWTILTLTDIVPEVDTWYFFAAWHDPVANEIGLRFDTTASTLPHTTGIYTGGDQTITELKVAASSGGQPSMDEFGIWHRVLNSTQLDAIKNGTTGVTYTDLTAAQKADLIAWWTMEETGTHTQRQSSHRVPELLRFP